MTKKASLFHKLKLLDYIDHANNNREITYSLQQPPSQIGPGNTSPTTFKVPKTEANVSSNDEPEDETSEVMVENTEDDSAV